MSDEWALVDRLIAERDRLAEALRDLADASDAYDNGSDTDEAVQWYFSAKQRARAALAQCAGTPAEGQDNDE